MRCVICNEGLTDFEATRKYADTNEFVDMCNHCYSYVKRNIHTTEKQEYNIVLKSLVKFYSYFKLTLPTKVYI